MARHTHPWLTFLCLLWMPLLLATSANGAGDTAARWVGTWSAAPSDLAGLAPVSEPLPIEDITFRTVVRLSAGGSQLNLKLSNELGEEPVTLDHVHVAAWQEGRMNPKTARYATFNGTNTVTLAAGAAVRSDPIDLLVEGLGQVVISIHVKGPVPRLTAHLVGQNPTWVTRLDETAKPSLATAVPSFIRYLVTTVEVTPSSGNPATIVALGDSITDGEGSTFDTNHRWPDRLAQLLQHSGHTAVGVVNQGISGNRLLRGGFGISALARLDRDVFSLPNARILILLEGINDVAMPAADGSPLPSVDEMISAYRQIIARAHEHGMKIVGATLMPYKGCGNGCYSIAGDAVRHRVNDWIRKTGEFDAIVDFDALTADRADPASLAAEFDRGDGIHPGDVGYEAMARAVYQAIERFLRPRE